MKMIAFVQRRAVYVSSDRESTSFAFVSHFNLVLTSY
jgi:hypothetical protein